MKLGLRVVRGKDWKWKNQDGGEGCVGTVREVDHNRRKTVVVVWDNGTVGNYRAGYQDADDLRVLDNAAAGVIHPGINCNSCKERNFTGTRWRCDACHDVNLCHNCYMDAKHNLNHAFSRIDTPQSCGVPIRERTLCRQVQAKGIYVGARVVRGRDWNHSNQDGGDGKEGVVQSIGDSISDERLTWRSYVKIRWDSGRFNNYCRGHKGNVDVKCVKHSEGELFYIDHLPSLSDYGSNIFGNGDVIKLDETKMSEEEKRKYAKYVGKIGKIVINEDTMSDAVIRFREANNSSITLPISCLNKVKYFSSGDIVRISRDIESVKNLQVGHGGWNDQMEKCLDTNVQVNRTKSNGDVKISIEGKNWILNSKCCTLISRGRNVERESEENDDFDSNSTQSSDDEDNSNNSNAGLKSTEIINILTDVHLDESLTPSHILKEAAAGNRNKVKKILERYPKAVDHTESGLTALQVACHQGRKQVVETLLNFNASIDATDSNGDNALHFSLLGDKPDILEILLRKRSTLVNEKNNDGKSCLHLAVLRQVYTSVKLLIDYECNVNLQDNEGETALHVAVEKPNDDIQGLLIDHPKANLTLKNKHGFNVLHKATLANRTSSMERILLKAPRLVDAVKADGFTALHIAALNGHIEAGKYLIDKAKANLETTDVFNNTPLLVAVKLSRTSMIELLIDKGANVNAGDRDGNTALHRVIQNVRPQQITSSYHELLNVFLATDDDDANETEAKDIESAPAILQICCDLPPWIETTRTWIAIAVYLIQNGASHDQENNIDDQKRPLDDLDDMNLKTFLKNIAKIKKSVNPSDMNQPQSQQFTPRTSAQSTQSRQTPAQSTQPRQTPAKSTQPQTPAQSTELSNLSSRNVPPLTEKKSKVLERVSSRETINKTTTKAQPKKTGSTKK